MIGSSRLQSAVLGSPRAVRARSTALARWELIEDLAPTRPIDVAERFRDLPGLALLESARPGRAARWTYLTADPVAVLDAPADGADPFADARALLRRMDSGSPSSASSASAADAGAVPRPRFAGGLVGYLAYDLGRWLERLPRRAVDDQGLPVLRLALHDWVIAWDRVTGSVWLGGRALDGDAAWLTGRLDAVRDRLGAPRSARPAGTSDAAEESASTDARLIFRSNAHRADYEAGVERVRDAIARGELYQANLARRLELEFSADPWPLYRRLRTGDPALFSAFLDLGSGRGAATPHRPGPAALLSASPEPFLSVTPGGLVATDPIKGTRPRGRTREEDRGLACELLSSAKDRAENMMIVDVLRNDLGRVARPGSVRVPRLCRLERTAAVQHLVSTVTARLAPGRDAFHLLAAAFPGGSITGAPKIRAMELLEELEPVRRGPYTGAIGWIGADGAMGTSIAIRTFVADGRRLTLHVGGGITWRSDPGAEWDETVAKARGPLSAIGAIEAA